MYCECFARGKLCNERCECTNCCNKVGDELQVYRARQIANFRHPGTFKGIPAFVPERKCTCKKSGCIKNYCECYRAGIKCAEECDCINCQNGKPRNDYFMRMEIEVNAWIHLFIDHLIYSFTLHCYYSKWVQRPLINSPNVFSKMPGKQDYHKRLCNQDEPCSIKIN